MTKHLFLILFYLGISINAYAIQKNESNINNTKYSILNKKISKNNNKIDIYSEKCENFTSSLLVCNDVIIKIKLLNSRVDQNIQLDSFWTENDNVVYSGLLDYKYNDKNYSIILSDINHDKNDDLIIATGKDGGYGGLSYSVYLYNKNKFVYHDRLSNLTIGADGLFRVKNKKLEFSRTSGCCEQHFLTYEILNNDIKLKKEVNKICQSENNCSVKVKHY